MKWECPNCHVTLQAPTSEELSQKQERHSASCRRAPPHPQARRIEDIVPREILNGNLMTIEEVLGKDVLVTGFRFKESGFKEDSQYLSLEVKVGDEEGVINTGAQRIIPAFRQLSPADLPVLVTFEKITSKGGKRGYRIKPRTS